MLKFKTGEWPASKGYYIVSYGVPRTLLGVCDLQVRVCDATGAEVARATIFRGIDTREECKRGDYAITNVQTNDEMSRMNITLNSARFSIPLEIGKFQVSDYINQ